MAKLNITWPQFAMCNENPTKSFEDMCRRLFTAEFLKGKYRPHADHNNAGIEVLPILEPEREDGQDQKRISFQCKYVERPSYAYSEFQKSANKTAKKYKGELDLVYLFCNKTLTTTAKGYQSIVKIHDDAGIETVPISNDEVLDMVSDYPEIAEYFFQARIVADMTGLQPTTINRIPVYMITTDCIISDIERPENEELLKGLLDEKLASCNNYALGLELENLKAEVEKLISFGAEDQRLYYYQFLITLYAGKHTEAVLAKCNEKDRAEAEWLVNFYLSPFTLSVTEFNRHTPVTQIFAIDKLFTSKHWKDLVLLYEKIGSGSDPSIQVQFDLHYGLSLLNLKENEKAKVVLHNLYIKTKERCMHFYDVCAGIRIENEVYQAGMAGHPEELAELIGHLESFKDLKQYTQQELFIAALKMESLYHLGIDDKGYLERAIDEFDSYSQKTRDNTIIQYYYALCLEMNGNRDRAIEVYENLDWNADIAIAERFMVCLILAGQPKRAAEIYESLYQRAVRTNAIYLFSLEQSEDEQYQDELQKAVEKYGNSLRDFIQIVYFTDGDKPARDVVVPVLKNLLTEEALNSLLLYQKIEILTLLAHFREIEMMEAVLKTIEDISVINGFTVGEIYKALFNIANKEFASGDNDFNVPNALESAERIADKFLAVNMSRKNFLQIKVLCAGAKKMPFSSLKYSKELFEITQDPEMARNIVALLFDRKVTHPDEYAPYLSVLEKSDNPDHCLVTAYAMLVQGKVNEAEFYAYKALYFLNGEDNYPIYRNYFGFCNYILHRIHEDVSVHSIRGGVVVMLEEEGGENRLEICLDPEADFYDDTNRSMGIEHLNPSNPDYIKLRGSGLGQVLRFRYKKYKIVQITPRIQYGLAFILRKIQEKPEMFRGVVWMISTENIDDMIKQIKELTDNTEQIKSLLAAYNFENNETGLPIDAVAFGDYSRYIAAFKYLLYKKDEAFYAGYPIYENEEGQKYVTGLATLVLLAIMGLMDVMDAFKEQIIIPESYIAFCQEEYSKAAGKDQASISTLFFVDDKPVMTDPDTSVPEIWEIILNFCKSCKTAKISDQERINFNIADGLSGERFISGLRLNVIHLDALLLAKREKATFLCDDLFFRKIAAWIGVRNLNIVSLVQHYTDIDYMIPIIKELSKTNYIYIPIKARNDDEFVEILENVLNGEKKEKYYSEIIQRFLEIRDRVFREYFGNEFVDRMYSEQTGEDEQP